MKNRPRMLSATFVRNVNLPGRYGDRRGGLGLSLLGKPASRGDFSKSWSQSVRLGGKPIPATSVAPASKKPRLLRNGSAGARGAPATGDFGTTMLTCSCATRLPERHDRGLEPQRRSCPLLISCPTSQMTPNRQPAHPVPEAHSPEQPVLRGTGRASHHGVTTHRAVGPRPYAIRLGSQTDSLPPGLVRQDRHSDDISYIDIWNSVGRFEFF